MALLEPSSGKHGKITLAENPSQKATRSILFVCSANQCRSPMAEGLFKNLLRKKNLDQSQWNIQSAGCWARPGNPATMFSIITMQTIGIDLHKHRSQPVSESLLEKMNLVLCMEKNHVQFIKRHFPEHAEKIYLLTEMVEEPSDIDDPVSYPLEIYQHTAEAINNFLEAGFAKIFRLTQ